MNGIVNTIMRYPKFSAILGIVGGIGLLYFAFTNSGSFVLNFSAGLFSALFITIGLLGIQNWNYEEPLEKSIENS